MRQGRVNVKVGFDNPEAPAAARLLRLFGGAALDSDFDEKDAAEYVAGKTPAYIAECIRRAKIACLMDGDEDVTGTVVSTHIQQAVEEIDAGEVARQAAPVRLKDEDDD
jgi:hypothetical protein